MTLSAAGSIILYFGIFFFSSFLLYIFDRKYTIENKLLKYLCFCFAISIPAFFAGLRALNIGTDTAGYGVGIFDIMYKTESGNFIDSFKYMNSEDTPIEFLYAFFIFFISRFTTNVFWELFIISFLSFYFTFLGARRLSKRIPFNSAVFMLIFYFFFYNESLNLMRQTLGVGIAIYAFSLLVDKKYIISMITFACSFLIHRAVLLFLIVPLLYLIIKYINKRNKSEIKFYIFLIIIGLALLFSFKQIVLLSVSSGILPSHYAGYVASGNITLYYKGLLLRLPVLLFLLYKYKTLIKPYNLNKTFFAIFLLEIIFINAINLSPWAYRLYGFISYTKVFLLAQMPRHLNIERGVGIKFKIIDAMPFLYSLIWWVYYSVYLGTNSTFPYAFNFY